MRNTSLPGAIIRAGLLFVVSATMAFAFPSARGGSRMAYEPTSGSVILYGGISGADSSAKRYDFDDTWQWTGRRWVRLYPANSPGGRSYASMAWFAPLDGIVLFGGQTNGEPNGDTWLFKGGNWSQLNPGGTPEARRLAGIAFDSTRNRLVLFGGSNKLTNVYDTWEFDGLSWTRTSSAGPQLTNPQLAYDASRDTLLLIGNNSSNARETHRYNNGTWEKLAPTKQPSCVVESAMVYQEHSQRIVHIGGACSGFGTDETWEWDGADWIKLDPKPGVGTVFSHSAAYDVARQETIVFGGTDFVVRNSTYRFRDSVFTPAGSILATPGPRSLFVMESDPGRGVVWLYGGQNESAGYFDLWKLQNGNWSNATTSDIPNVCASPAGTFDTDRGRLVLLCEDSSTYEWDGEKWYTFASLKNKPPSSRFRSMAYDASAKKTLTFGGFNGSSYERETWGWNGTEWTRVSRNSQPKSRALANMFYDPISKKTYLYGGIGQASSEDRIIRYGDFHALEGDKWVEMKTGTFPPARYGAMDGLNPESKKTVIFGGKNEKEEYINEQWEWNGSAWAKLANTNSPSARMNGGLSWDPAAGAMSLYGGYAGLYFSELWALRGGRWELDQDELPGRRRPRIGPTRGGSDRGTQAID